MREKQIKNEKDIFVYHYTGQTKPWVKGINIQLKMIMKILKRSGSPADFKVWFKYRAALKAIKRKKD